jgi:hypothetical protein
MGETNFGARGGQRLIDGCSPRWRRLAKGERRCWGGRLVDSVGSHIEEQRGVGRELGEVASRWFHGQTRLSTGRCLRRRNASAPTSFLGFLVVDCCSVDGEARGGRRCQGGLRQVLVGGS